MHIDTDIKTRVEQFLSAPQKHMGHALGIEFLSFKKGEVRASMPVDEHTIQPFGILHGGASVALAETLASIGAWLNIDGELKSAVGIEINANHIKAVPAGEMVTGVSTPLHRGNRIHVWETKIHTKNEKLVCVSRCTLAIVDKQEVRS